jgi:hypothetical protein
MLAPILVAHALILSSAGALPGPGEAPPAVLLDPLAARAWALGLAPGQELAAAEALLLAGDPGAARTRLEDLGAARTRLEDPGAAQPRPSRATGQEAARRLRLEADVAVALLELPLAEARLEALSAIPGWETHARQHLRRLSGRRLERQVGQAGILAFALALALLVLGGGRELLRPRVDGLVALGALAGATLLAVGPAAPVLTLLGAALLSLTHARGAALARAEPGPRGRALLAGLLLLGGLGAALAIAGQLGLPGLARLVATP